MYLIMLREFSWSEWKNSLWVLSLSLSSSLSMCVFVSVGMLYVLCVYVCVCVVCLIWWDVLDLSLSIIQYILKWETRWKG